MLIHIRTRSLLLALPIILISFMVHVGGFPATFKLERVRNHPTELSQLRDRDVLRHSRPRSFNFPLYGTSDVDVLGYYYTKIKLGSPSKEYYVLVDTGSDVLWVSCNSCNGCPTSSQLHIPLEFYNPSRSSTASMIPCSNRLCSLDAQSYTTGCPHSNNRCNYTIIYGDLSEVMGYYVYDLMHINTPSVARNFSAYVAFGCTTFLSGHLSTQPNAIGGILGLGPGPSGLSLIRQLSSQGLASSTFAHCLVGNNDGGGILVIGQISEPDIVYTPLVPSQPYYNVNLQRISVNGRKLSIDPSIFAISGDRGGTIVDSGASLAYFPKEAFHSLVDAITKSVSQPVQPVISNGSWCYLTNSSVSKIFPTISFEFADDATMILRPQDYLLWNFFGNGKEKWCIGFQKSIFGGKTILGELLLKDKLVVYDLGCQRIGWKNYDCSSSVNVSSTSDCDRNTSVGINDDRKRSSSSLHVTSYKHLLLILILARSCY